ncbi:MAG: trypsin-like peptidase domain-containing protein [Candidatus Omnitrophota bacterium]
MKKNLIFVTFFAFLLLVFIFQNIANAAEGEKKEFEYYHKKLSQIKEQSAKYRVAIGSFGETIDIPGSSFNKIEKKVEEGSKTYNLNIGTPNLPKPEESKVNLAAGMLSDLLKKSNKFDVIERKEVNQLVREIQFEKSDWVKKDSINQLGNIYGVQYILLGDILPNKKGEKFGASQYTTALRLVDINTGSIIATGTGQKNNLQDALAEAVNILTNDINVGAWTCRVVQVDSKGVYINAGLDDNIEKNDVFSVIRLDEPIKDKTSGSILGYKQTEINKIKIIDVLENKLSLAKSLDPIVPIKEGDIISAKRVEANKDNEINLWNKIFGGNVSKREGVSALGSSGKLVKKSLTVSSAENIVEAYGKSVVLIQTQSSMGSGFVVSSDGLILTNSHVINTSETVTVKFIADNRVYSNVKVVKNDTIRDLALLKIDEIGNFTAVVLGDSDQVAVGERVVAIGNPEGLENTVSDGLISAIRDVNGTKLIQISAPISSGSSGGALFNMNGEVIGITSASFGEGQNLNFAVAINHARSDLSL